MPPKAHAPSLEMIETLACEARAALPAPWAALAAQVPLRIEDFAPDDMLAEMGIEDPYELTGLYDGTPIPLKSFGEQVMQPDVIWLFRRPILDEWVERGNVSLSEMVTHVLVHEFAHHFGWSDEDIAAIDPWWE